MKLVGSQAVIDLAFQIKAITGAWPMSEETKAIDSAIMNIVMNAGCKYGDVVELAQRPVNHATVCTCEALGGLAAQVIQTDEWQKAYQSVRYAK